LSEVTVIVSIIAIIVPVPVGRRGISQAYSLFAIIVTKRFK